MDCKEISESIALRETALYARKHERDRLIVEAKSHMEEAVKLRDQAARLTKRIDETERDLERMRFELIAKSQAV